MYRIKIPDEFVYTTGKRQVSITLAFDPPVRHTNLEYLGIGLEFHLFRGVSEDRIITDKVIGGGDANVIDIK